jgi:rhodanese-related sulfurtransferase
VQPEEAYQVRDDVIFVDVREFYEYDAGHIDGAVHIPLRHLPGKLDLIDPTKTVVVACQIGQRSDLAAGFLREHGYDAHNLEGGMTLWAEQGLPFVSNEGSGGQVIDGWAQTLE